MVNICGEPHPTIGDCFGCQQEPDHKGHHQLRRYPTNDSWFSTSPQLDEDHIVTLERIVRSMEKTLETIKRDAEARKTKETLNNVRWALRSTGLLRKLFLPETETTTHKGEN